jgi:hypothetical protein
MIGEDTQNAITAASGTRAARRAAISGITPHEQKGDSAPKMAAATIARTTRSEVVRRETDAVQQVRRNPDRDGQENEPDKKPGFVELVEECRHLTAGFTQGAHDQLALLCAATTFVRDHHLFHCSRTFELLNQKKRVSRLTEPWSPRYSSYEP